MRALMAARQGKAAGAVYPTAASCHLGPRARARLPRLNLRVARMAAARAIDAMSSRQARSKPEALLSAVLELGRPWNRAVPGIGQGKVVGAGHAPDSYCGNDKRPRVTLTVTPDRHALTRRPGPGRPIAGDPAATAVSIHDSGNRDLRRTS